MLKLDKSIPHLYTKQKKNKFQKPAIVQIITEGTKDFYKVDLNEIPNHFVDEVMNKMPVIWLKDYPGKEKEDFFAQSVAFFYVKNVFKKDKQPDAFIIHLISTSDVPLIKSKLPRDIHADGPLKIYPCDTNSFQGHK